MDIDNREFAYLLHKDVGLTSFRAIRQLQKHLELKKIGHCGTLDKFAEGLLIVLSGSGTKFASALTALNKEYIAEVHLGMETATLDPEGAIIARGDVPSLETIMQALENWNNEIKLSNYVIEQVPPAFSAIHSDGKRLYQRALAGEDLSTLPARRVLLYSCEFLTWEAPKLKLRIRCSKGFYVRAFARDLGYRCGSYAYLTNLSRTAVGNISLDEAKKVGDGSSRIPLALLLNRLKDQLALQIWQIGCEVYTSGAIPLEDQKLLAQGRIPHSLQASASAQINRDKDKLSQTTLELELGVEIALLHDQDILGLFRWNEERGLRFWHNFYPAYLQAQGVCL